MASSTWVIRSAKLLHDKELASVLLLLMMAMNDLGVANSALYEWDHTDDPKKRARQNGGKLYFGRMQMAHVYEALLIIQAIKANPRLMTAVKRCNQKTQASFDAVAVFLKSDDFKILCRIRNNAAFHYDRKLAIRYLEQIVEKLPNHPFAYSLGHET